MICIKDIYSGDELGQFRGNDEMLGWKGSQGGEPLIQSVSDVRQVAWLEGKLQVSCESENGEMTVLTLDGFVPNDFDSLLHYFQQACGVHIQTSPEIAPLATASEEEEEGKGAQDKAPSQQPPQYQEQANIICIQDSIASTQVKSDPRDPLRTTLPNPLLGRSRRSEDFSMPKPLPPPKPCDEVKSDPLARDPLKTTLPNPLLGRSSRSDNFSMPKPLSPPKPCDAGDDCPIPKPLSTPKSDDCPMPKPPAAPKPIVDVNDEGYDTKNARLSANTKSHVDEEVTNPNLHSAAPSGPKQDVASERGTSKRNSYIRSDSIVEGWVWKRSRYLKKWRRRWVVLTNAGLETYADRSNAKSTEFAPADSFQQVYSADGEIKAVRCFCVVTAKRSWYLVCDDEAQKQEWISQISRVLYATRSKRNF